MKLILAWINSHLIETLFMAVLGGMAIIGIIKLARDAL